ncbi:MAG: isocitrate/isopropylmalate dehydrogenase family protein [Candidatus Altiarchaeota archaeon]|nr:isocitrate/isopropylmalate dehydrogenase family protein [Candidatus Altiarchaeota archaeon]
MPHKITLIPGDGIGPEVIESAKRCIQAAGVDIEWDVVEAGVGVVEKHGTPLPPHVVESIRRNGVALKGPVTTPVGNGFRSVNVELRISLDLYACVRPCKSYAGVPSKYSDVDIVVVRENTEDLYVGIEFEQGKENTLEFINVVEKLSGRKIREDSGISIKPISVGGTSRISRFAFDYAVKNRRRKVTAVDKANIMKHSDGLFMRVSEEVSKDYPTVSYEHMLIDALCAKIVQNPKHFDVIVMPNLYGDIISDLCAGLVGGLGIAPSANIGEKCAVFEATHGSAPDIAGQNKANPTAILLSSVMMLRHIGETRAADRLERALARTLAKGTHVTSDIKPSSKIGTKQMTDAIVAEMRLE